MSDDRVVIALQPWQLPPRALDDYAEYRRQGGRFPLGTWWTRYKDDYHAGSRCSDNTPAREGRVMTASWVAFDDSGYPFAFALHESTTLARFARDCGSKAVRIELAEGAERSCLLDIHAGSRCSDSTPAREVAS